MTLEDFRIMMPAWAAMNARVENDTDAIREFNWVRDMYAYSFAAAMVNVRHHVPLVPWNPIMVQPPADTVLGQAAILHYTWGPIVSVGQGAEKKARCRAWARVLGPARAPPGLSRANENCAILVPKYF